MVTGKEGTPLNEVELIVDSLGNDKGVFPVGNVVNYIPAQSMIKLKVGDKVRITAEEFEPLFGEFLRRAGTEIPCVTVGCRPGCRGRKDTPGRCAAGSSRGCGKRTFTIWQKRYLDQR